MTVEFPLYLAIPIKDLAGSICQTSDNPKCWPIFENYFKTEVNRFDKRDQRKNEYIDIFEAIRFMAKMKFGYQLKEGSVEETVLTTIRNKFFNGEKLDCAIERFGPLVVSLERCSDGDTCVVLRLKYLANIPLIKIKFRFNAIDTPESFRGTGAMRNPKLLTFKKYIWLFWKKEYGGENISAVKEHIDAIIAAKGDGKKLSKIWDSLSKIQSKDDKLISDMIEDRIVYDGLLAGAVTKGLEKFAEGKPFSIDVSCTRVPLDPAMCNTIEFADVYERFLGRLRIGLPDEKNNILGFFIANELPNIMAADGRFYYEFFRDGTKPPKAPETGEDWSAVFPTALTEDGKKLLNKMKDSPKGEEMWMALSPETIPDPTKIFSKEFCKELAFEWVQFSEVHPEYKNDVQAMLVFLHLAWVYPKYRTQHTDMYLEIEAKTLKCMHKRENKTLLPHGLASDPIYKFIQPNPIANPLFAIFGEAMANGKNLLPEDCCVKLKRENKDIYNHCGEGR